LLRSLLGGISTRRRRDGPNGQTLADVSPHWFCHKTFVHFMCAHLLKRIVHLGHAIGLHRNQRIGSF
jgi:hypothetical protein